MILRSRYKVLKVIGSDRTSQILLANDLESTDQSLRIIQELDLAHEDHSLTQFGLALLLHKTQALQGILEKIDSANNLLDYFIENSYFYIVETLIRGTTLPKIPISVKTPPVKTLIKEALYVICMGYEQGLTSCCLYPSDLLLCNESQRLIWTGFGLFKGVCEQIRSTTSASLLLPLLPASAYMAPESLRGQYHATSDIYVIGMVGIQLVTQRPLVDLLEYKTDTAYPSLKANWYRGAQVQTDLIDVLVGMTQPDHNQRYQYATDVLIALQVQREAGSVAKKRSLL